MKTNSANSITGSASAAARALAASLPAVGHELAEGALRAGQQFSAGLDEAREQVEDGRNRLVDALEAAVVATRSGLRQYGSQAEQQLGDAADRSRKLRAAVAARGRDGLAYSAELGGRVHEQLRNIGTRVLKSAARHPYATAWIVAAACYLIVRRMTHRAAGAKAAGRKKRARRAHSGATTRARAKESRAGNGSASA